MIVMTMAELIVSNRVQHLLDNYHRITQELLTVSVLLNNYHKRYQQLSTSVYLTVTKTVGRVPGVLKQ